MANNKSAKKRILTNERQRLRNRYYKGSLSKLTKLFLQDIETYKVSQDLNDKAQAQTRLNSIYSFIDKSQKQNILHKNKAARKKSQLAAQLKLA